MLIKYNCVRAVVGMPFDPFGRGRLPFTFLALIPSRTIAQISWSSKHGQISDAYPSISAVKFADHLPTLVASRFGFRAFNRNDYIPARGYFGTQDTHIGNIQWNGDLWFCNRSHLPAIFFLLSYPYIWRVPRQLPMIQKICDDIIFMNAFWGEIG